jgi:hypothetical protein
MKIKKVSLWHEVLILVLYVMLSPIFFGLVNSEDLGREGMLAYIFVLVVTVSSAAVSFALIVFIKELLPHYVIEILLGLIPLLMSLLILTKSSNTNYPLISTDTTFIKSNTIEIVTLYAFSIFYKLNKNDD